MRGHLRQRSERSWAIVVDIGRDPETGRRRQRWHTVSGRKRDAQRALREILHSMEKGSYVEPNKLTVAQWLAQWCESYVSMHTTLRTQESYNSIVKHHLVPALGSILLSQLQPQHIQKYYAKVLLSGRCDGRGGLSARSVLYHHRIISEALDHAVKMGLAARNVANVVDPPRVAKAKLNVLKPDELSTFLNAARETPYYVYYCTLLYTGLRRGEALALKWGNVDLLGAELQVVETAFKLGNGTYVVKEPKTPHSCRLISLPPSLAVLLRQYRSDQELLRHKMGKSLNDNDFVFTNYDGTPLDPNIVTRTFSRILKKAELPHIRLHDLRHTHATLMLKAGVHPKIVSERLGHANIGITLDTYSHVLPGLQEAAAEKFDRLLDEEANSGNQGSDVSKMLANQARNGAELLKNESERCGSRTHDALIKSQVLYH
jgi:integrase